MNKKWHFASLILLIFIVFGTFQEQKKVANQEIVLEFIDQKIDENNINLTVEDVKQKLIEIGASNIEIVQEQNGTLKISYHSILAINEIEDVLTLKNLLKNNPKEDNKKESSNDFYFDIYELTNEIDSSNLAHKNIIEFKFNTDRFNINNSFLFVKNIKVVQSNHLFKVAYRGYKNSIFIPKNTSQAKPEVRAGPTYFNSKISRFTF